MMAYPNFYNPYPQNYYNPPMQDQLSQLRQQQQYQMMQNYQQQQNSDGRIRVQGEVGAKAYLVAPGNTVELWDTENPVIYLKSADMSGMPSMRILDYKERTVETATPGAVAPQQPQYVTIDAFNSLADRLTALENNSCKCDTKKAKEELVDGKSNL